MVVAHTHTSNRMITTRTGHWINSAIGPSPADSTLTAVLRPAAGAQRRDPDPPRLGARVLLLLVLLCTDALLSIAAGAGCADTPANQGLLHDSHQVPLLLLALLLLLMGVVSAAGNDAPAGLAVPVLLMLLLVVVSAAAGVS